MKHTRFFSLLARMPGADKEQIVYEASGFTSSLSEYAEKDPQGYWRMVGAMAARVEGKDVPHLQNVEHRIQPADTTAELKRHRSAILIRLQKHGLDTTNWATINAFMKLPRVAGKQLNQLSIDEMKALIPKLEAIMKKEKARLDEDAKAKASRLTITN